jgi:1-acyl-sn-glycerol-3-phosphate acyltransferase
MRKLSKHLHHGFYLLVVILCFLVWWPWLGIWARHPQRYRKQLARGRKYIAQWSASLAGFKFKNIFQKDAYLPQQAVYCANHSSNLDISALILSIPYDFSFLGKAELLQNPVTKLFFKSIDIPVLRSSKISAYRAYQKSAQVLAEGKALVIFPEGGISEQYPPVLQPFKSGSFRLAIEKKVPIVPVVIHGAWEYLWDDGFKKGSRPGTIEVEFLRPVDVENYTLEQADVLGQKVYNLMAEAINSKHACNNSSSQAS